jgi:hypothetical protein
VRKELLDRSNARLGKSQRLRIAALNEPVARLPFAVGFPEEMLVAPVGVRNLCDTFITAKNAIEIRRKVACLTSGRDHA